MLELHLSSMKNGSLKVLESACVWEGKKTPIVFLALWYRVASVCIFWFEVQYVNPQRIRPPVTRHPPSRCHTWRVEKLACQATQDSEVAWRQGCCPTFGNACKAAITTDISSLKFQLLLKMSDNLCLPTPRIQLVLSSRYIVHKSGNFITHLLILLSMCIVQHYQKKSCLRTL